MKKVLISVLVVLLLIGAAGITAGYFFVYKPAKAYLASVTRFQELPKIEAQVRNQASFAPPSNGELTPERVDRFVRAQQALRTRLGGRIDELTRKYRTLNRPDGSSEPPSVKEALNALRDLANLVLEAKQYQVEALNEQNFSVAEYDWIRARVYEASGIPLDQSFQHAIREAASGKLPNFGDGGTTDENPVPEANRKLVAPHVNQLTEAAPLAFFGL